MYVAEIERTIYNGVLGQIPPVSGLGPRTLPNGTVDGLEVGIRHFALLHKKKMASKKTQ